MKTEFHAASVLSIASCLLAPAAVAQNADPEQANVSSSAGVGEIVVTAQRRSELARDVPISLTAISGDDLVTMGVTDTNGLQKVTPGLIIESIGIYNQPAIRGITTVITGPGVDANVATYLDGVYQLNNSANAFDLPDVERVEVLKGPQGTLFGRNATGGAIQVFTKAPSYTPGGTFRISYGNYDDKAVQIFATAPVIEDRVAFSIAGYYRSREAYEKNLAPIRLKDNGSKLIRGKLRLDPLDAFTVTLSARYSESQGVPKYSLLNGNTEAKLYGPGTIIAPQKPHVVAVNEGNTTNVKAYDFSGTAEWDVGIGTIKSITAYQHSGTGLFPGDSDGAYTPGGASTAYSVNERDDSFSQELNFGTALDGPFNAVAGIYYTKGTARWDPLGISFPNGFALSIFGDQGIEAIAGFGELTYEITPSLTIIGGLRYSWEERSLESNAIYGSASATRAGPLIARGKKSWDAFTPRASIRYALTPRDNIYFTYSQGFKSGAYNTSDLAAVSTPVNPENIKAYEIGYKGNPIDAVYLTLAAFYYDHTNLQQNTFQLVGNPPVPLSLFTNAAATQTYGAEADANIRLSNSFSTRIGLTYLDAKFDSFPNAGANVPNQVPGNPPFSGNTTVPYDASGQTAVRAPKFTASVTPNLTAYVADGKLNANATVYFSSRTYLTFDHRISQPAYAAVDANLSFTPDDSGITMSIYGRNLTDKGILSGAFITTLADTVTYKPPRTYGVSFEFNF